MSRLYIFLLGSVGLLISSVGAFFSIVGLTHLFSGAPFSVGVMAGSLEAAKLVTAGFLFRYWGHIGRVLRTYLGSAVVALSIITSLGVFGFLSHAYQKSSFGLKEKAAKIEQLKTEDDHVREQIAKIDAFIENIPSTRISKKFALYEESRAKVNELNQRSEDIQKRVRKLELEKLDAQSEIGPLLDVSQAFGVPVDTVAKTLILMFVSVFDPLAICLVFAWGLAIRLRQKYRGNEARISRLSLATPVDHRYKKSA